jgi:hypothetical protein
MSGLDAGTAGKLLENLAPVLMGFLGQQKRAGGLDAGGLAKMLGQERANATAQSSGAMGFISSLLDQDGDGSVVDDLADLASKFMK